MGNRLKLHEKLKDLLGSDNVYYQPPSTKKMEYPAIRYSKKDITGEHADNIWYLQKDCYEVIVICRTPDHPVIKELLNLPYCSWDRWYPADNMNHDVLTLYD